MDQKNNKKSLWYKLKRRYQFNVMNEENYEVKSVLSFSILNVILWIGIALLLMGFITYVAVAFTPLKQYIPGYGKIDERKMALNHQLLVDSLEIRTNQNTMKLRIMEKVLSGDFDTLDNPENIFNGNYDSLIVYSDSKEDSVLRAEVEQRERFSIFEKDDQKGFSMSDISLFPPIRGVISDTFNGKDGHYGIDVVATKNKEVKSVYDGTVIFSEFAVETGYVLGIQHEGDLISIYRHNSQLNKEIGSLVKQGEVIATAGNTGELSSGPHLHFELWYKGEPIDPSKYINFE